MYQVLGLIDLISFDLQNSADPPKSSSKCPNALFTLPPEAPGASAGEANAPWSVWAGAPWLGAFCGVQLMGGISRRQEGRRRERPGPLFPSPCRAELSVALDPSYSSLKLSDSIGPSPSGFQEVPPPCPQPSAPIA